MSGTESPAARLQALFEGHRLTPTQRRIAHSMVRRAADVPFLSSVELAELAGVSQPSVTRFAVALGFDGYPALRKHLREVVPAEPAAEVSAYNEYQQAVEAEIENLRHLAEVLADPGPVRQAGRVLAGSRPLPVLGLRAAAVGTGLAFDTACAPMLLGRVLLEAMCDDLPDAQARLEEFDTKAAARGLFVE